MSALVLVGMSVSDVDRRAELLAAADRLDATVAFLQMGDPSLSRELTRLADLGAEEVTLVAVSLGLLAPGHSWLRRIAAHWWRERAGQRPSVVVATRLVTSLDQVEAALVDVRPVRGDEPGLTSDAWEHVDGHRHQVLVCRGPRCTARGSDDVVRALVLGLVEAGLGDHDVLVTHTGCQLPCNQAPVVTVQPDDVWYGGVDASSARLIVTDHLVDGRPVEGRRLPR
ncbi:(2Fe-2S) ferredoxin domain-containing protein [Nocardioides marmoribigeumensis]|uniref:(2Fe-2S) ferredoxin n=1 Tax=Nocardioides marmoribigeumensis TaxID=433649 RepID=A0ABU2BXM5_9ACTN|nr:(2Fe-2S) ferredoxin domain-containing protein [Nocardioides marmoribigeumensis]MDR7363155.1 (2Fe-2S) ferredoxin [Nocardioides marmoribigeumensis]